MTNYTFPTAQELLEAGVHFGHSVNKWNPKMEPYIYAAKKGVHILDLDQTQRLLKEAGEYLYDVALQGGEIIFVCTKKQASQIVKDQAIRCGACYVNERWVGGTITNYKVVKKSIDKLTSLKKKRDSGELSMYTKKERLLIDREIDRLEKLFGGIANLKGEPQAVVVVDARREKTAINECKIFGVPVVALIDTNSDPTGILKPIPGNDDAAKSISKILAVLADCVEAGYKEFEKAKAVEQAKRGRGSFSSVSVSSSQADRVTEDDLAKVGDVKIALEPKVTDAVGAAGDTEAMEAMEDVLPVRVDKVIVMSEVSKVGDMENEDKFVKKATKYKIKDIDKKDKDVVKNRKAVSGKVRTKTKDDEKGVG